MQLHVITLFLALGIISCQADTAQENQEFIIAPKVTLADFESIAGSEWVGTLTYLNYGEPKIDYTIRTKIDVSRAGEQLIFFLQYPNEPQQNSRRAISITNNGRTFAGSDIIQRIDQIGSFSFTTTETCEDEGRPATCNVTYSLSPEAFSWIKMVTIDGTDTPFRRNHYEFTRQRSPQL